ncbi:MAG: hypothetical protein M3Y33_06170, partial [Actinomycetota bacterium]|nr:hypothetical protein [Actinomycetota bacterium]
PGTQQLARWFNGDHIPDGIPKNVSGSCAGLAWDIIHQVPDGPELTAGLRKLLEAKDCFVRAAIASEDAASGG